MSRYKLKLFFEWGGGCLWCDNDEARADLGVGPMEDRVPLSPSTRDRLQALSQWHDTALNWDDPRSPSPWTPDEAARFDEAARTLLLMLQAELGPQFEINYPPDTLQKHK